jgi:hypothetical protein
MARGDQQRNAGAEWAQDFWKALMLSPTIEICEALLDGESVPIDRLDPDWVRRFGLKAKR